MMLTLSFQAEPPIPYHTFNFHYKKLMTQNRNEAGIDIGKAVTDTEAMIRELLQIPDEFEILTIRSDFFDPMTRMGEPEVWKRYGQNENAHLYDSISELPFENGVHGVAGKYSFIPYVNLSSGACLRKSFVESQSISGSNPINIDYSLSVPVLPKEAFHGKWFSFAVSYGLGVGLPLHIWSVKRSWLQENEITFDLEAYQPDLLSVLVLNAVITDMLNRGITIIRNEITYKSITLYQALERSKNLAPFIASEPNRSSTIICAESILPIADIQSYFRDKGISLDYYKGDHPSGSILRIANFPVHSKEQVEMLADIISAF